MTAASCFWADAIIWLSLWALIRQPEISVLLGPIWVD